MQLSKIAVLAVGCIIASCTDVERDQMPVKKQTVETKSSQQFAIKSLLEGYADDRKLSMYQNHYQQEFGCSNIYKFKSTNAEIVVINPFNFKYDVLVYSDNKTIQADVENDFKRIVEILITAHNDERSTCS